MFVVVVMKLGWVVFNKVCFHIFTVCFLVRGRCGDVVQEEVQVFDFLFNEYGENEKERRKKKQEK